MKFTQVKEVNGVDTTVSLFNIQEGQDTVDAAKDSAISIILGYTKTYELLHKQLWRKNRVALGSYTTTINGREAKPILFYNIKSASTQPYDRDHPSDNMGLNQLFMGQSPYDTYNGDPGDGIYHDDCLIQPKIQDDDAGLFQYNDMTGWYVYDYVDNGEGDSVETTTFYPEFDNEGTRLINDVTVTSETISTIVYKTVHIYYSDGTVLDIELTTRIFPPDDPTYGTNEQYDGWFDVSGAIAAHGEVVYEEDNIPRYMPRGLDFSLGWVITVSRTGKLFVFADGTAIQLVPPSRWTTEQDGAVTEWFVQGGVQFVPMVYTDTGDLVINHIDFVENWDEMFELYVHEDSYWYTPVIKIVIIVIAFIIAYFSSGSLSQVSQELFVMASTIGAIGGVSGNKMFQLIGLVGSIYGMLANGVAQEAAKQAIAQGLSERTAQQIATEAVMEMSFQSAFSSFTSQMGLGNLVEMANSVFGVINVLTMQTQEISQEQIKQAEEKTNTSEDQQYENNEYILKIMRIGELKSV